ncbi:MAG: hypothetical protein KR126chlam2_00483, partial [Chlamydiae bacterium]|nr:hypothetical protein [Chlamydiota bacterium]
IKHTLGNNKGLTEEENHELFPIEKF